MQQELIGPSDPNFTMRGPSGVPVYFFLFPSTTKSYCSHTRTILARQLAPAAFGICCTAGRDPITQCALYIARVVTQITSPRETTPLVLG
jgi:hypothetical protein